MENDAENDMEDDMIFQWDLQRRTANYGGIPL